MHTMYLCKSIARLTEILPQTDSMYVKLLKVFPSVTSAKTPW